jgi:hypothetical protein
VVSQNEKEFVYKELNIFRQSMPNLGVTWNLVVPSFVIQFDVLEAFELFKACKEEVVKFLLFNLPFSFPTLKNKFLVS